MSFDFGCVHVTGSESLDRCHVSPQIRHFCLHSTKCRRNVSEIYAVDIIWRQGRHISHHKRWQPSATRITPAAYLQRCFSLCWPCRRRPCRSPCFLTMTHSYRICSAATISEDGKWSTHNYNNICRFLQRPMHSFILEKFN